MDNDKLNRIKARLAEPRDQVAKHATADDYVRAMLAAITASRQAGKTWKQISVNFGPDVELSADSLRQAFERARRGKAKSSRNAKSRRATGPAEVAQAKVVAAMALGTGASERPKIDLGVFAVTRDSVADFEGSLL